MDPALKVRVQSKYSINHKDLISVQHSKKRKYILRVFILCVFLFIIIFFNLPVSNLALGKPVFASSNFYSWYDGEGWENAVDGLTNVREWKKLFHTAYELYPLSLIQI